MKKQANYKKLNKITPGEILQTEFLEPMNITIATLSQETNIQKEKIEGILKGIIPIDEDTATKLSIYLNISKEFWINAQISFENEVNPC